MSRILQRRAGAAVDGERLPDRAVRHVATNEQRGHISDRYAYVVFGAMRSQAGTTANDFRYTGQQDDQNANRGLYYLRARSYDPSLGRFLQRDPIPFMQRYAYGEDNAANLVDPTGLFGLKDLKKAASTLNDIGTSASIKLNKALNDIPGLDSPVARAINRALLTAGDAELAVLERFATPQCLAFGLDVGGYAAIEFGGPFGVPLAAGFFATSLAISVKEQDFVGGTFNGAAFGVLPFQFDKFAPALQGVARGGGQAAIGYSAANCGISALK